MTNARLPLTPNDSPIALKSCVWINHAIKVEWVLKRIHQLDDELNKCQGSQLQTFNIAGVRNVKKQLSYMHQMLRPMKEVLSKATEDMQEAELIAKEEREAQTTQQAASAPGSMAAKYMRDVYSHLIQILEDIEAGTNECRDLTEVYNMKLSNKQADVLYVLTFVTIFISPIQVLSGIYGMNFKNMPELHSEHGYQLILFAMAFIALTMGILLWRRGWIVLPNQFGANKHNAQKSKEIL